MIVADEKMLVNTALGTLVAYASDDDERPGIFIDLRRSGFGTDAPLVYIECDQTESKPVLKTRAWGDVNFDDATDCITHDGIREFFTVLNKDGAEEEYKNDKEN